ncbi:MAG: chorismate mutase [Oscillospiraceae bacterium]|nr:chorismate mutase [Oscillospiraceae bacterium]
MNLDELRQNINALDAEILKSFEQRMELCRQVALYKQENGLPIFQTDREKDVIHRIRKQAPENLKGYASVLFQNIMDISKYLQYRELHKNVQPYEFKTLKLSSASVACQGTAGANAETAAKQIFGQDCKPQFFAGFADVFSAVQNGDVQFGVIPVENSTAGSVVQAYDLMDKYNFYINKTTVVEITNCLAVKSGTKLEQIKEIFSHPQALSQCSQFIANHQFHANEYSNTATAAKMVAETDQPFGAICSENCAELHGLEILQKSISDCVPNNTRFICISKELLLPEDANRISVMLKLPHEEGSLYRLLSKFLIGDMNLLKLESRPIKNGSFEVMFYLDFSGNIHESTVCALLSELSENLEYFKFLGNYSEI